MRLLTTKKILWAKPLVSTSSISDANKHFILKIRASFRKLNSRSHLAKDPILRRLLLVVLHQLNTYINLTLKLMRIKENHSDPVDKAHLIEHILSLLWKKYQGQGKYTLFLLKYNDIKEGRTASSYSIRMKTSDFNGDRLSYKQNPGPGTYQDMELRPANGKLNLSKFQNTRLASIKTNTKRFL